MRAVHQKQPVESVNQNVHCRSNKKLPCYQIPRSVQKVGNPEKGEDITDLTAKPMLQTPAWY